MRKKKTNKERLKSLVKNKNFIVAICVIALVGATMGISYASFFSVKSNSSNQNITTGTLQVSYGSDTTSAILKENMSSMSDEMGMNQSTSKLVHIQNTGTLDSTFVLDIGYDMDNFTKRSGYSTSDSLTPLDYIMIAVYEYNGSGTEDTLITGPIAITDLPIYSYNSSDSRYNRYTILVNTVGSTSSGNATKTYKIKTWLSDQALPAVSYSYFYINTEVVAEVVNAKMKYNFTGTVKNSSGTALSNAVVSFQNNSQVSTTNSSGTYTISGVYPGVYNIDITYDNVTYSGNLTVVEGSANALVSLGTSFTGSNIYAVCNTYGTTINKVIKKNNLEGYTDVLNISSGSLSPTYKFTGGATENITGVNFTLNATTGEYSMSLG